MAKRLSIFFSKNPILTKIIIFLILFITIFSGYLFFQEFYYNNWTIKEGLSSDPYTMKISITDNTGEVKDPIPNGLYSVFVNNIKEVKDPIPNDLYSVFVNNINLVANKKINSIQGIDLSLNNELNLKYNTINDHLMIIIKPQKTNIIKPHYSDVFPEKFMIDYYLDPNCNVNYLNTSDSSNNSITNKQIITQQAGVIFDESFTNNYGSIASDPTNPYHFLLSIRNPVELDSVIIIFSTPPSS